MRPIVFHLADKNMETGLRAFFRRQDWHYALRCARFEIDSESSADIFRIGGCTDQGLWKRAHENLATHLKTHERVIVIIDEHFTPSPGAIQIHDDIVRDLFDSGWQRERFEVIVIQPMLEAWLWMDSSHVANAFGFSRYGDLRSELMDQGLWDESASKPRELKKARDFAAQRGGRKTGGPIFKNVFTQLSSRALDRCTEPGFALLRQTLQTWFGTPSGGAA